MACTLFRLTPEEALRGVTVHAARALGLADRGTLAAGKRADFVVWDVEHPRELAYWFGDNPLPPRRARRRGATGHDDDVFTLHRGTHAAAGQRAARRHARCRPTSATATSPRALAGRGHRLAPRPRSTPSRATLGRQPDRAALQPLPDRPQPADRQHADVPRRQQHRAVPDALLHRRAAVPRRPARPTAARSQRRVADLLAAVPRRAARRARSACTPRTATPCCSTATASRASCRGCSKARCRDLNLGTVDGRSCAPRLRAALVARAGRAAALHATSIDGRFKGGHITRHYGQPDARRARGAAGDVLALLHGRGAAARLERRARGRA